MSFKVQPVEANYVAQIWHLVEPFIEEALNKESEGVPDYNAAHVQVYLTNGTWLLLVAVDEENAIQGAMTLSFINYPMHRVAFVTATGGKFVIDNGTFKQLTEIAKRYGATKIQAFCRDSMVRLLEKQGFKPRTTLVEVTI